MLNLWLTYEKPPQPALMEIIADVPEETLGKIPTIILFKWNNDFSD